jgi:hypothetical protein
MLSSRENMMNRSSNASTGLASAMPRLLSAQEIADYREGGAAVIRGILPLEWVECMGRAVDRILASPGTASVEYTPREKQGRYYGDFLVWLRDPDFKALMMDSPLPEPAAQLMGAKQVSFFVGDEAPAVHGRGVHVRSTMMFPPASSPARQPGGMTQVASYSSTMTGPASGVDRSDLRITGVWIQPFSGPK